MLGERRKPSLITGAGAQEVDVSAAQTCRSWLASISGRGFGPLIARENPRSGYQQIAGELAASPVRAVMLVERV